jgi:hypothetical protein
MGALEDVLKGGNIATGVGMAIGVAVVAPIVLPLLRPIAKSFVKAGVLAYDQGRAVLADLNEQTSDLVAEARPTRRAANVTKPAKRAGRAKHKAG